MYEQNRSKKKFISSLRNSGWRYWRHFQAIQPNASAKGRTAFQPSLSGGIGGDIEQTLTPAAVGTLINEVTLPTTAVTSLSPTSTNPPHLPYPTTEKRPFISLDSDSETGTRNHCAPSSTLVGSAGFSQSKTTASASMRKAPKTLASSTAHSSSDASHGSKLSSIVSKYHASHSETSSTIGLSKSIKMNTMKDLGNALVAMKDSLLISPEEATSKLHCEATSIIMKDMYLSMQKRLHVAMLIRKDISYAESLMGMLEASLDNDGMETNALHAFYDEITKDL